MTDEELEHFKTRINLTELVAGQGYELDRRESSRNSAVMRHPGGDNIIIARNEDNGNWIYFSVPSALQGSPFLELTPFRSFR